MNSELSLGAVVGIGLTVGFFYLVYRAFKGMFGGRGKVDAGAQMICPHCGTRGQPAVRTRGSFAIELVLWLCLILPGLVYSIWRITSREQVCPACKSPGMIQVNTPRGQQLVAQFVAPRS